MKNVIQVLILGFLISLVSCKKDNPQPIPPKYSSMVGSWKMEANSGVGVSFDIIVYDTAKTSLYVVNAKVTYLGQTSVPSEPEKVLATQNISDPHGYWMQMGSTIGDAWNLTSFPSLDVNAEFTKLTGTGGFASVYKYDGVDLPPPYWINFTSPIVINRTK